MNITQRMKDYWASASTFDKTAEHIVDYTPCPLCKGLANYCPACEGLLSVQDIADLLAPDGTKKSTSPTKAEEWVGGAYAAALRAEGTYARTCADAEAGEWYQNHNLGTIERRALYKPGWVDARIAQRLNGKWACQVFYCGGNGHWKMESIGTAIDRIAAFYLCEKWLKDHDDYGVGNQFVPPHKRSSDDTPQGGWYHSRYTKDCYEKRNYLQKGAILARVKQGPNFGVRGEYYCYTYINHIELLVGKARSVPLGILKCEEYLKDLWEELEDWRRDPEDAGPGQWYTEKGTGDILKKGGGRNDYCAMIWKVSSGKYRCDIWDSGSFRFVGAKESVTDAIDLCEKWLRKTAG